MRLKERLRISPAHGAPAKTLVLFAKKEESSLLFRIFLSTYMQS